MPLPDTFWGTQLWTKPLEVGDIYIDVVLNRRADWPNEWTPEEIWDDPDFRDMSLTLVTKAQGQHDVFSLIEIYANYFGTRGKSPHRVQNGTSLLSMRDGSQGDLGSFSQYRRLVPTLQDITWLFAHWRPEFKHSYTADEWLKVFLGNDYRRYNHVLQPKDRQMLLEALELSKGLRSPFLPVEAA